MHNSESFRKIKSPENRTHRRLPHKQLAALVYSDVCSCTPATAQLPKTRQEKMTTPLCPAYAPFFGFAGVASAVSIIRDDLRMNPDTQYSSLLFLADDLLEYVSFPHDCLVTK